MTSKPAATPAKTSRQPTLADATSVDPDTRLLRSVRPRNLLSFGPDTPQFELQTLNVLIGANASGKSNFIEIAQLLHALPTDLAEVFKYGGGIQHWIWKSQNLDAQPGHASNSSVSASIEAHVNPNTGGHPNLSSLPPLQYQLEFSHDDSSNPVIHSESLSTLNPSVRAQSIRRRPKHNTQTYFAQISPNKYAVSETPGRRPPLTTPQELFRDGVRSTQSYLYQQHVNTERPTIARVAQLFRDIKIYREWSFGRFSTLRRRQRADERSDMLESDLSNVQLVLSNASMQTAFRDRLLHELTHYAGDVTDFSVITQSGTVELIFREGNVTIPASRLSDGALRFICLLVILCDPNPPPLICIEEPELGLHMDVLPTLVRLMEEAATRTQLIVTTHSTMIIDLLSHRPESVVICEKIHGQTQLARVNKASVEALVDQDDIERGLAWLWRIGILGGTR